MIPNILSIAGSDPSGGAGIQADLKAIAANGGHGMAALTALTAQNTQEVRGVHLVPTDFVRAQIETVFADVRVDAVKLGMLATAEIAAAVADALEAEAARGNRPPVVLDPVMVASSGARLLDDAAVSTIIERLMPLATIVTPNLWELEVLTRLPKAQDRAQMAEAAEALLANGAPAVFAKGGHLKTDESPDLLLASGETVWLDAPRVATRNTHGTGCTTASSIATYLGHGRSLRAAVEAAKAYIAGAIAKADTLQVGQGHGPVHHFYKLWSTS
ncbi:MAG: bifunctional hydroxymethylpyrimidine kinase/phosphomethylpyrimidine kinase [Pseudomonadota bacterium]